jgi:hypothetical protein
MNCASFDETGDVLPGNPFLRRGRPTNLLAKKNRLDPVSTRVMLSPDSLSERRPSTNMVDELCSAHRETVQEMVRARSLR